MTSTIADMDEPTEGPAYTAAEQRAFERQMVFGRPEDLTSDRFPRLWNMSAGFMARAVTRPIDPEPTGYVRMCLPRGLHRDDEDLKTQLAVVKWNLFWESAQFRRRYFDEDELPPPMAKLADRGDVNITFVPQSRSDYYAYAPLYHLLSRRTLERFGLPLLARGCWPFTMESVDIDKHLPTDFATRLARAWASAVWPHLDSGSTLAAYRSDEPIRLLAHNLDFWLPAVTSVIEQELGSFPLGGSEEVLERPVTLEDGSVLEGATWGRPRKGGDVWSGEDEAQDFLAWTIEEADASGKLRGIIDAVRSHRVQDDFSSRWSYAKEDFERRLHHKRSKVSVRFVELTDTIPVQGPETEIVGNQVTADFMALLDEKERQIVILLNSGTTKLTDIAGIMGYKNHSPISKKLVRIRAKARQHFDEL